MEALNLLLRQRMPWLIGTGQMGHDVTQVKLLEQRRVTRQPLHLGGIQAQPGHSRIQMQDSRHPSALAGGSPAFDFGTRIEHRHQPPLQQACLGALGQAIENADLSVAQELAQLQRLRDGGHKERVATRRPQPCCDGGNPQTVSIGLNHGSTPGWCRELLKLAIVFGQCIQIDDQPGCVGNLFRDGLRIGHELRTALVWATTGTGLHHARLAVQHQPARPTPCRLFRPAVLGSAPLRSAPGWSDSGRNPPPALAENPDNAARRRPARRRK